MKKYFVISLLILLITYSVVTLFMLVITQLEKNNTNLVDYQNLVSDDTSQ